MALLACQRWGSGSGRFSWTSHNTRSFGEPTSGFATAIQQLKLSDGTWLGISVAVYADRTGQLYGLEPIPPDESAVLPARPGEAPQQALDWLLAQPTCQK